MTTKKSYPILLSIYLTLSWFFPSYAVTDHSDLHIAVLGDSNTWIGGDDCKKDIGWTKWFKAKFQPASITSYARSGATWTNNPTTKVDTKHYTEVLHDNNVIYNQVKRLIEAVDAGRQSSPQIIIIAAGSNDAWFESKRPGIYREKATEVFNSANNFSAATLPSNATSLPASIKLSCETLMLRFPEAQIVLLTSPQITKCSYDAQNRVNEIIEECGRRMSINVIRLDAGNGTYADFEKNEPMNTSDGAHNNTKGARRTGNFVASQLDTVLLF